MTTTLPPIKHGRRFALRRRGSHSEYKTPKVNRLVTGALWSPVAIGAAYFLVFLNKLPSMLERIYWDSDAATAAVIVETSGRGGETILGHYGWYTTMWLMQATRWLPFHRDLWNYAPYAVFLCTMAMLTWVTYKQAGRWAAAMTATGGVALSPFLTYVAISLNFHTNAWAGSAVLGTYAYWLTRTSASQRKIAITVWAMALYSGVMLSSDHLFGFVALIPFASVGLLLMTIRNKRLMGAAMVAVGLASIPVMIVTDSVMSHFGYSIWQTPAAFASISALGDHFGRMLTLTRQLVGGDQFFGHPFGFRAALAALCTGIITVGIFAPFYAVRRAFVGGKVSIPTLAYATFWSVCVLINTTSYVFSSTGDQVGFYLITLYYATIATLPIALSKSGVQRAICAAVVGVLALSALAHQLDNRTRLVGRLPDIAYVMSGLETVAQNEGVTKGYSGYWESASTTWTSRGRLQIFPIASCPNPDPLTNPALTVCPFGVNIDTNWYRTEPGKSFYLQSQESLLNTPPPPNFGEPLSVHDLGRGFTVYVFPYDISSAFNYKTYDWRP